jgi:hypothetical protein
MVNKEPNKALMGKETHVLHSIITLIPVKMEAKIKIKQYTKRKQKNATCSYFASAILNR